jgi:hypothetical protein
VKNLRYFALWLVLAILLAACRPTLPTPAPAPTDTPAATSLPTAAPTPTTVEPTSAPTAEPTATSAPQHVWLPPIAAEEPFTRNPLTAEEQATFDLLAQANFTENDPIALAIAVKGVAGPVALVVATEALTLKKGTVEKFWIHNSDTNKWTEIEARLERVTDHAYLWFDTHRELVDKESIYDNAAQAFEQMYAANIAVYGSEWNPGIDGDPHVYVIHAAAPSLCNVTEATAHQCGLLGYFSTTDELPLAVNPHSNQHELFVMNMDAGGIGGERYLLTLVHEFRHMIEYNYDRHDDDWEVEGTAMMAEDLLGYPRQPGDYGNAFTGQGTDLQLNAWTQGNTIPHYGKGYLFSRYIYNRMGREFYIAWVQHPDRGFFALDAVLQQFGYDFDAHALWLDWAAAVSLMGFENVPQQYTFGDDFFVDPARATSVNTFPKQIESEVSQYAFDVYEIRAGQPIQLDFSGTTKTPLVENILPASGKFFWWSGRANQSDMSLTRAVDLSGLETATLNYSVFHSLELGYDFAYVLVSKDEGKSWETLTTPNMQGNKPEHNPADAALTKRFYTGRSKGWMDESIDLSRYAGRKILIRFQVVTDAVFTAPGLVVDNIAIPEIGFTDDVETLAEGWETQGFLRLSAYAPQRFDLLLITFEAGDKPSVQRIALSGDNTAALDISLAEGNNRALLIVAASTPLLLTPASYQLSFRAP